MSILQHRTALIDFIARQTGGKVIELEIEGKLGGGAIQENWALSLALEGGSHAGKHALVLRTDAATGIAESRSRVQEFALIKAAHAAGMTVPEPLWLDESGAITGKPFTILRRLSGVAEPRLVLGRLSDLAESGEIEEPGDVLVHHLGQELARLHQVVPAKAPSGLGFLPTVNKDLIRQRVADYRRWLDRLPEAQPVLEWALNWIEDRAPEVERITLCHRDFRLGNIMIEEGALRGILDFEFAGWSDPDEDLGWFCARCWRFGAYDKEAGGLGSKAAFFAGYAEIAGRQPDPQRVRFWEIVAALRWALIALDQGERCFAGGERRIELALTALRAIECEYDLLLEIDDCDAPPKPPRHKHGGENHGGES
ncbi:MAG TPA: phosphotransferase family protein [Dongiaceae bacterium]|nr:phosphotransferase family protein [Dongiaceae bacterium]